MEFNMLRIIRNLSPMFCLSATLVWSLPTIAEPLDDARAAIHSGEHAKAMAIYEALAREGNAKAEFNLGQMYINGDGVQQDVPQAVKWYRLSADHGYSEAQYTLGALHFRRYAALPSDLEAIDWYRRAADQGHLRSQLNLGDLYFKGEVVPQDISMALGWYRLAASQGNGDAQHQLGVIYANGVGVDKDVVKGCMWFLLAADNAEPRHRARTGKLLNFTAAGMTAEQLEEARSLARHCTERGFKDC
jgi:TPR repeat protein